MIQEKRNMLKTWNLLLIGLTYTLCLFGTFLTRSGIVQSVHAFAQSPIFTSIFLGYVLFSATVFFIAVAVRRKEIRSPNRIESVVSREAGFLLNNWVFISLLVWVFTGTLFPVASEIFQGEQITVGPGFFPIMAGPLALFLLFLTGVGPLIAWRRASLASVTKQFCWPATIGLITSLVVWYALGESAAYYPIICWGLGAFAASTIVQEYALAIRARVRKGDFRPSRRSCARTSSATAVTSFTSAPCSSSSEWRVPSSTKSASRTSGPGTSSRSVVTDYST
jgi:cytochrome c-type biogenesis protein CcmF